MITTLVWVYLAGWIVTAVAVCRWFWLRLDPEERDEAPTMGRFLTLAGGLAAGLVWPACWAIAAARDLLWPEPAPDPIQEAADFDEEVRDLRDLD